MPPLRSRLLTVRTLHAAKELRMKLKMGGVSLDRDPFPSTRRTLDAVPRSRHLSAWLAGAPPPPDFMEAHKFAGASSKPLLNSDQMNRITPSVIWLTCGKTSNAALRILLRTTLPKAMELFRRGDKLVEISGGP